MFLTVMINGEVTIINKSHIISVSKMGDGNALIWMTNGSHFTQNKFADIMALLVLEGV